MVPHAMQKPFAQELGRPVAKCPPKDPRRGRALRLSKRGWWRRPLRGAFTLQTRRIPCRKVLPRRSRRRSKSRRMGTSASHRSQLESLSLPFGESETLFFLASPLPPRGRSCTFPLLETVSSQGEAACLCEFLKLLCSCRLGVQHLSPKLAFARCYEAFTTCFSRDMSLRGPKTGKTESRVIFTRLSAHCRYFQLPAACTTSADVC